MTLIHGLIPQHDYLSLPAPAWALMGLLLLTFWLHLIFIGGVLGSVLFILIRRYLLRRRGAADHALYQRLLQTLPVCLSLTITLGVAPLLFVQVLYGHYFYSANIFLAWFWMGLLVLVLAGFAGLYVWQWRRERRRTAAVAALTGLCFLGVLYIMTQNGLLTIMPEYWIAFQRGLARLHVQNAITVPRLLHNVGGALVISGLLIAWSGRMTFLRKSDSLSDDMLRDHSLKCGMTWLLAGLVWQIAVGLWYLWSVPGELRQNLWNLSTTASWGGWLAAALALLTVLAAFNALKKPEETKRLCLASLLPLIGLGGMVMVRQQLRANYLAREVAGNFHALSSDPARGWTVQMQWSGILLFAATLLIGIVTLAFLLKCARRAARDEAASGDK